MHPTKRIRWDHIIVTSDPYAPTRRERIAARQRTAVAALVDVVAGFVVVAAIVAALVL